jgi:hypothetical protein
MTLYIKENYFNTHHKSPVDKKIRLWIEENGCGVVATDAKDIKILAAWSISAEEITLWEKPTTRNLARSWQSFRATEKKKEELATFQTFLGSHKDCHLHLVGFTCTAVLKLGIQYYHQVSPLKLEGDTKVSFEIKKGFKKSRKQY